MSASDVPPPPPPPGMGGPGGPPPPAGGFSVGTAFNYGWTRFQGNVGPFVLTVLLIVVAGIVINFVANAVTDPLVGSGTGGLVFNPDTGEFEGEASVGLLGAGFFASLAFSAVSFVVNLVIQAGLVNGALGVTRGQHAELGAMFGGIAYGQVVLAAVLISVATFVGLVLCVVPGLIVIFLTWFTYYFLIDQRLSAVEAIRASVGFVSQNLGSLIGLFLASLLAIIVGALLCLVGLLAAIPVVLLAQAFAYRTLRGEPVA